MGLFGLKWKKGLGKTREGVFDKISRAFQGKTRLDDETLESIEEILIESDMGVDVAMEVIEELQKDVGTSVQESDVFALLKEKLSEKLVHNTAPMTFKNSNGPYVLLVVGVNGTGKTTTIGKLAARLHQEGKKVLLAGADTFRAAAGEQLEVWAKRVGVDIVKQSSGADPASVAYDALDAAIARGVDVLIVDTAGRLHNKINLMEELKKIKRVLSKRLSDAPHDVMLVLDATTGQNGLQQAKTFSEIVDVSVLALTKLDGTAKGGIVFAIQQTLPVPVHWVGLGEGIDDLIPFDADDFIEGLFENNEDGQDIA